MDRHFQQPALALGDDLEEIPGTRHGEWHMEPENFGIGRVR